MTSSPKGTSPILSSGPATFSCRGNGLFSISVWKCLLPLTSSPRPWVNKQLCSPNNYAATQAGPQVLTKDKAREEAEIAGPGWRKKMPAKGMSPQKGHLIFEQELTLSPPWWRTRSPSCLIAHDMDPIKLTCLSCAVKWFRSCIIKGKVRMGWLVYRKTKELWLSWWKLSGPVTTTDIMRSATTGEATS